jgi:hypothetical protein
MVLSGLYALVLLCLAAAAALGSGRRLLGLFGAGRVGGAEKSWIGAALGLGLLSLGTLALAGLSLLGTWPIIVLLAGLVLWGWSELKAALADLRGPFKRPVLTGAAWLWGLVLLWVCLMPPHQYDSLVYHLVLPETYVRLGRLASPPHLLYSHFPQNGEMLFTLALALKSDILAQMLMWLSSVLCLGMVFSACRRELGEGPAWLALGIGATHTALLLLGTVTYVEPLVMLWTCGSVLSLQRWRVEGGRGWLLVAGAFSGLALGTKYTAGATAGLLALVPLLSPGRPRALGDRLKDSLIFAAVVSGLFLPWLVKNLLTIGNPVFPFLYSWFPMTGVGWGADTAQRYFRILAEYGHGESWVRDFVTLPYQLLVNFQRYGGGMDVLGCLGWTLVLAAAPVGLWPALKERESGGRAFLRLLAAYCVLHFLVWFATGTVLRFLTAIAPLLACLAAAGLSRAWLASGPFLRPAVAAVGVLLTGVNLGYFLYVHAVFETGKVLLGRESRSAYLSRKLAYYPCAAWCRANLAPNDRILLVGEQRAYYLGRDHVASTVNAPNRWVALANEAENPSDLTARLKAEGVTAVLFVPRELERLFPALGPLTETGLENLKGLPGAERLRFTGPACGVFSL